MKAVSAEEKKPAEKKASKGPRVSWEARLLECKTYRKNFGHCKIPTSYNENKTLGVWVQEQRRNFKLQMQGKKPRRPLTQEQIDRLNEVDFYWGWTPDPNLSSESEVSWEANFQKLQEYKESHGNFDIPMESGTSELSRWARVQRNQYNLRATKRKSFITVDRIKKMDGIGFNWDGPRKLE